MELVTEWFGAFLVEGGRVVEARPFPPEPGAIAERLHAIDRGEVVAEELAAAAGKEGFAVAEQRQLVLPGAKLAPRVASLRGTAAAQGVRPGLFREAVLELARRKTREALGSRDQHVLQAVQASDDLAEAANLLAERLREWYGLHLPESERVIARHEELAGLVSVHGRREALLGASPHLRLTGESMGAPLGPREEAVLRGFARGLSTMYAQRAEVDKFIESAMPELAPNVTQLVGPAIAARLLYQAGGLREMATLPSGTIQTLGAEKALFRHLKEGNRPPKHGIIFQHPLIHKSPMRQRGALARSLAGKIAIAARADAYSGKPVAAALLADLERRVAQVRTRQPRRSAPPPPKSRALPPARGPPPPAQRGDRDSRRRYESRGPPPRRGPPGRGHP